MRIFVDRSARPRMAGGSVESDGRLRLTRRRQLGHGTAVALVVLFSAGCLTLPPDPAPTIANSTDETVYATFWSGSTSDPGFAFVRPNRELQVIHLARDERTGCLTAGGWHTMELYDRDPDPDIEGDVERDDLLAEPIYVHDIEEQPLCADQTWTWNGEQLLRTD